MVTIKRFVSIFLIIITTFSIFAFDGFVSNASICPYPFSDVSSSAWYSKQARYAFEHGYMTGTANALFSPNEKVTRAMFSVILSNVENADVSLFSETTTFNDVSNSKWYHNSVEWAYSIGLTKGTGYSIFSPSSAISRQDLVVLLYNYVVYKGIKINNTVDITSYSDFSSVSSYAKQAMAWAVGNGLISGTSTDMLSPRESATRAQISAILYNFDLKKFGHRWSTTTIETVAERTCTKEGKFVYTCKDCGITRHVVIPAWHTYKSSPYATSYTQTNCILKYKCMNCGEVKIQLKNHSFSSTITNPTCTTGGIENYKCTDCGYSYSKTTGPLGHNWSSPSISSSADGCVYSYSCLFDSTHTYSKIVPHSWDNGVVTTEPTATQPGVTTYTCSICKGTYTKTVSTSGGYYTDTYGNTYHYKYYIDVEATAYGYAAGYITSTGLPVSYQYMAVDPKIIPYHTKCYVTGVPLGTYGDMGVLQAEDCGAFKNYRIDIFLGSESACRQFGRRQMRVYILD